MIRTRAAFGIVATVARRPDLWTTGVRQLFVLAPQGWWKRWPPLPVPDDRYLAFRMETAYGDPNATPEREDVISYLEWCRRQPHLRR